MDKKVCVIGGGRWGKNHVKTLAGLDCLGGVCDSNLAALNEFQKQYPGIKVLEDFRPSLEYSSLYSRHTRRFYLLLLNLH